MLLFVSRLLNAIGLDSVVVSSHSVYTSVLDSHRHHKPRASTSWSLTLLNYLVPSDYALCIIAEPI